MCEAKNGDPKQTFEPKMVSWNKPLSQNLLLGRCKEVHVKCMECSGIYNLGGKIFFCFWTFPHFITKELFTTYKNYPELTLHYGPPGLVFREKTFFTDMD